MHSQTVSTTRKSLLRRWLRRLFDLKPYEMAWVDYGANHRVFAVVKEDTMKKPQREITLESLVKARTMLDEVIPVMASDAKVTPEAVEVLVQKLDAAAALIMPVNEPHQAATVTLTDGLIDLRKQLETFSGQATATDYTLGDQIDAMVELAKQLEVQAAEQPESLPLAIAASSTEEPEPEKAAVVETKPEESAAPAEETKPEEAIAAAPAETPEVTPPANPSAPGEQAPIEAAPVEGEAPATLEGAEAEIVEQPTAEASAPDGGTPPPVEVASDQPVATETVKVNGVTREEVADIVKAAVTDLRAALVADVQKSLNGLPVPATNPAPSIIVPSQPDKGHDPMEEMDLTQSADLDSIDDYGRFR